MTEKLNFITPTLMAVFELFLSDPMQSYHEREVVRSTSVSNGSANKMLRMLADLNFLTRERKGRMVFYRLNAAEPAVRQFKVLTNIYALRKLLEALRQHSRRIILFGSCAQGTDVKESDIDLFVLSSENKLVRNKINEFNKNKGRKITPVVVGANEFTKLKREEKPFYENIERGIMLWEAE